MKLDLLEPGTFAPPSAFAAPHTRAGLGVDSEYGRLRSVLLGDPSHLAIVPCNSMSRESLRNGLSASPERALRQHADLVQVLEEEHVEAVTVPARADLPDGAFTRDTSLMSPWGLIGLRPGAVHRRGEVDAVLAAAEAKGVPLLGRVERGRIEGGDVAMIRPGLLLIGISGERTDEEGADALASLFRARGWRVMLHRFDPHFLHLDTLFCTVDRGLALACTDVLDDDFVTATAVEGIELLPVAYKSARALGCNLLSLGDRRVVLAAGCTSVSDALSARGYRTISADVSEFTRCGGGIHCLTMPLDRAPG